MNPNQKEKLSCEARAKRKIKLQAEQEELRVAEEAEIAMEEKRKLGVAKRRVETVLVEISGPNGHVGRCHIPTAVVVQLGLFRILLGSMSVTNIGEKSGPSGPPIGPINVGVADWQPGIGPYDSYGLVPSQDGGKALLVGSATGLPVKTA